MIIVSKIGLVIIINAFTIYEKVKKGLVVNLTHLFQPGPVSLLPNLPDLPNLPPLCTVFEISSCKSLEN